MTTGPPMLLPVTLAECPIGLFWHGETLCLKTEYGNNEGRIDAYIIESGEFYWGDHPQTIINQRAQLVIPIDTDEALAALTRTTPPDQQEVERVARAICNSNPGNDYDSLPEDVKEYWRIYARAALSATKDSGTIAELRTDCEFLLSVIDSCDEAEAPSCEMEPEDVANIARIRASLQEGRQ